MNLKLCALLCNFLVLSTFTVVTGENVNMKKNVAKEKDMYSDDEDFADGSGNGGDPLESSGSGYGPGPEGDDENLRGELPGSKKTQLTVAPKTEKDELQTIPIPPKPQTPPPQVSASEQPEVAVSETSKPAIVSQPETKKLPEPEEKPETPFNTPIDKNPVEETNRNDVSVFISNNERDRTTSFFAQPGILAAVIGGAVVGLLCAILVVMFIVYRMRKKDEGSYALEEMKRCPATNPYMKPNHREFFA